MAKQTVERRRNEGLCTYCGNHNDRYPKQKCTKCANNASQKGKQYYNRSKVKVLKRTRDYYQRNKEKHSQWTKAWWVKNLAKKQAYYRKTKLEALGIVAKQKDPKCVYCGCDDIRFLEINHKNGGGSKEGSRFISKNGNRIYRANPNFYWGIIKGKRLAGDLEVVCAPHNRWHFLKLKYGGDVDKLKIVWQP